MGREKVVNKINQPNIRKKKRVQNKIMKCQLHTLYEQRIIKYGNK